MESDSKHIPQIFLVDGLGALLSFSLLVVLAQAESFFGMPQQILYRLLPLPVIFCIYSLSCYWLNPIRWKVFLSIIATANMLYCCLTLWLMYTYFHQLTIWGILYFLNEKLVVTTLSVFEFELVRRG